MSTEAESVRLFLCGDVMLGRGVDQILAHPSEPRLLEEYLHDARDYVALAERLNGPVPRRVPPEYVWGDAIAELNRAAPDARIINLETSVTESEERWPGKEIHYRMHPENVGCLSAARVDVAVLANNHVLDHGLPGLDETLRTLHRAGLCTAGAGRTIEEAQRPAEVSLRPSGRVLVFGIGAESSGVPPEWAASARHPGIELLRDLSDATDISEFSERTKARIAARVESAKRPGDVVVASIHWGSNWGYDVPASHVRIAHALIDAGVDLVHGHSSHHPRPIEVFRGHLILYGCGDFLDDYEGIRGYEAYRSELVLMYLADLSRRTGELLQLRIVPWRIRRFQLERTSREERSWLERTLATISARFGTSIAQDPAGDLILI